MKEQIVQRRLAVFDTSSDDGGEVAFGQNYAKGFIVPEALGADGKETKGRAENQNATEDHQRIGQVPSQPSGSVETGSLLNRLFEKGSQFVLSPH